MQYVPDNGDWKREADSEIELKRAVPRDHCPTRYPQALAAPRMFLAVHLMGPCLAKGSECTVERCTRRGPLLGVGSQASSQYRWRVGPSVNSSKLSGTQSGPSTIQTGPGDINATCAREYQRSLHFGVHTYKVQCL